MKLISTTPLKGKGSNYKEWKFAHRIMKRKEIINVRADNEQCALKLAWQEVKFLYKTQKAIVWLIKNSD